MAVQLSPVDVDNRTHGRLTHLGSDRLADREDGGDLGSDAEDVFAHLDHEGRTSG